MGTIGTMETIANMDMIVIAGKIVLITMNFETGTMTANLCTKMINLNLLHGCQTPCQETN